MRYIWTVCLFLLLCSVPGVSADTQKVMIGVSLPLSGALANYGEDVKKALIFANSTIGKERYDLVFEDDRSSPKDAVTIAQRFASIEKVRFVLGFAGSGSLLSAAPVYENHGMIVIASIATSPRISSAGDFIFRTSPSDAIVGQVMQSLLGKRYQRVAIISEETDYCEGILSSIVENSDLEYAVERFPSSSTDVRSLLMRLKSKSPEALILNPQSDGTLVDLVKQLNVIRWKTPLYGAYFPGSPSFLGAAGDLANGITYVDLPSIGESLMGKELEMYKRFVEKYGTPKSNDYWFVSAYNSFVALHHAIQSGQEPRSFLYSNSFPGVSGSFSFDKNGDIVGIRPVVKRIEKGVPRLLDNSAI